MNKELNIGDYVRWCNGDIARITDITKYKTKEDEYYFDRVLDWHEDRAENHNIVYEGMLDLKDFKSSPNIIDLIEVGDILKFKDMKHYQEVLAIDKEKLYLTEYIYMSGLQKYKKEIEEDLEWVITHEQIEQMHYKIRVKGEV